MPWNEEQQREKWHDAATRYVKDKKSIDAIAAEMDVDESTVRAYLANALVPRRRQGRPEREDVETDKIVRMRIRGALWKEIAAEVGMSISGCYTRWEIATKGYRSGRDTPQYLQEEESQPSL